MVFVDNTKIAFASKTEKDLKKMRLLFKIISKGWIISFSKFILKIALFIHFPIKWLFKYNVFKHFCGGENIDECKNTVRNLSEYGIYSILDYSAESSSSSQAIENVMNEIINTINFAKNNKNIPFAVFKPSAIIQTNILEKKSNGIELNTKEINEFNLFKQRIDKICFHAKNNNIKILIDAEYFKTQDIVDVLVTEMMEKYNKDTVTVFNTLQMYRNDRLQYLKNLHKIALSKGFKLGIKFVRGAYLEEEKALAIKYNYPSPVHNTKDDTDKDFNNALEYTISNIETINTFCGTHNEQSSLFFAKLISKNNLKNNDSRLWLSQLYGMSDNISFNFAEAGFNVIKYIPYGEIKKVLPYLIRRADENKSVAGQTNRELEYLNKEIKRRKNENRQ